jgi:uncharacterized protein (DUF1015 family)
MQGYSFTKSTKSRGTRFRFLKHSRKFFLFLRPMADIRPFRALRYNPDKIRDINLKFSPLFDVVNPLQIEQLRRIPNNSIHLSVPVSTQHAVKKLRDWREKKVLIQDPLPGIYIYYQRFTLHGQDREYTRKGFISMIRMKEGADDDIILHEDTITSSVNDRIELLEKTLLNVAPTHGLYEDPEFSLESLMDSYMEKPLYQYIDYQGVINMLTIVQDPADIQAFMAVLRDKPVYLADGHHRLESSRVFRDKQQAQKQLSPDAIVNFHLMYLTNMSSDDFRILPTHRVWKPANGSDISVILGKVSSFFEIKDVTNSRQALFETVHLNPGTIGMVHQSGQWLLSLRSGVDVVKDNGLDLPPELKKLDYTVLHYFLLDRILGIPYRAQHLSDAIVYEKDYFSAVRDVESGKGAIAFIMNEVNLEQMLRICAVGAKMPQKSTYFYPKVVCGLVFGSIDENENQSPFDSGFRITEEATTAT